MYWFKNAVDYKFLYPYVCCKFVCESLSCVWLFATPVDCSLPGSSVHGILQARILEWVAISFSRDLPNPGIEPRSLALQADALPSEPPGKPYTVTQLRNKEQVGNEGGVSVTLEPPTKNSSWICVQTRILS